MSEKKPNENLQGKSSVQALMKAEQEAAEIVKQARIRRTAKLRKAEDEAKEEILAFKTEREQQFQEYKAKKLQTDFSKEINVKKERDIKEIKQRVDEKLPDALEFIVQKVLSVQFE